MMHDVHGTSKTYRVRLTDEANAEHRQSPGAGTGYSKMDVAAVGGCHLLSIS